MMIKFYDFEPIDVSKSLYLPSMREAIVRNNSLAENKSKCADDEGWILVTRRRHCKADSQGSDKRKNEKTTQNSRSEKKAE